MALSRTLYVDITSGSGDFNSIQDAIDYAVAQGASNSSRWTINVGVGIFVGDLLVPVGFVIRGVSKWRSSIQGAITIHAGSVLEDAGVFLTANQSYFGIRIVANAALDVLLSNLRITVFKDVLDTVSGIECTGGSTGGLFLVQNSYIYVSNKYSGTNTGNAAKFCFVRLKSDFKSAMEVFNSHLKTSSGPTGTAQPIAALVEQTGGSDVSGYVHIAACDWTDAHGMNGIAPDSLLLSSANTGHPGGIFDLRYWNLTGQRPGIVSAYVSGSPSAITNPGASPFYSSIFYRSTVMEGNFVQVYEGDAYNLSPTIALDHAPTGADEAPEGSLVVVTA